MWIDGETGLPIEVAKKIKERFRTLEKENSELRNENDQLKQRISALEEENQKLKEQVSSLQEENDSLKQRVTEIEEGSLGVKKIADEDGGRVEFMPEDQPIARLTSDGFLKPVEPNTLVIGDQENYLNDVVTANITVASLSGSKENIRELDPSLLDLELPNPKIYERVEGKGETEIGFITEELPPILRRGNGYDLKALVALLAWKVRRLEERLG